MEVLIRPDLGNRAYRLRCRFVVDAAPQQDYYRAIWRRALEKMQHAMAERFISDMAKQGWGYLPSQSITMTGPFSETPIVSLRGIRRPHFDARRPDLRRRGDAAASLVSIVPDLDKTDRWEYELAAVFVHKTLLMEVPTEDEERKVLASW